MMKCSASVGMHIAIEAFFLLTLPTISKADVLHAHNPYLALKIHIYIRLNNLITDSET